MFRSEWIHYLADRSCKIHTQPTSRSHLSAQVWHFFREALDFSSLSDGSATVTQSLYLPLLPKVLQGEHYSSCQPEEAQQQKYGKPNAQNGKRHNDSELSLGREHHVHHVEHISASTQLLRPPCARITTGLR